MTRVRQLQTLALALAVSSAAAMTSGPAAGVAASGHRAPARPQERPTSPYPRLSEEAAEGVRSRLAAMKSDPRGPYLRIRWICNDGSTRAPQEGNCSERGGGHQRAEFKSETLELGALGFHPGTILMALSYESFVDRERANDRLRELIIESYLVEADDGWVLRRARYYRGASQIEDEDRRGREYLERLLGDEEWRRRNPLLAALLVARVPHGHLGIPGARIRQLAEDMTALDGRLQELRIKIHSRPGPDDLAALVAFRARERTLPPALHDILAELERELSALYIDAFDARRWGAYVSALGDTPLAQRLRGVEAAARRRGQPAERVAALAGLMLAARRELDDPAAAIGGRRALTIHDLILYCDALLRSAAAVWESELPGRDAAGDAATRREHLDLAYHLIDVAYATGWLTEREHGAVSAPHARVGDALPAAIYRDRIEYLANAIDWAQGALRQTLGATLERYRLVEPAVVGIEDALIRGSALLAFANTLEPLSRDAAQAVGIQHSLMDVRVPGRVVGLNPGLATGPLHIVDDPRTISAIPAGSIAVIPETDAELGRVAGILTLQEGSRLSHVQLLARSLGLPNAAISPTLVEGLRKHAGTEVFYAVSTMGTVVMKPRNELTAADLALVDDNERGAAAERFSINEAKLDLETRSVLTLDEIGLADSGRIVGPKAANLAHLRRLFPGRTAPGIVVPFGVFRRHIERDLLGTGRTLYEDLAGSYRTARAMEREGVDAAQTQTWILARLRQVREVIQTMELLPDFAAELRAAAEEQFGASGTYGVFVRSDTNVEDLPNFTGAGLNLTVMNQIGVDSILHAIRMVWASPFSERSFTWRQQLLDNPQHVYPSVLLMQSVPAEVSGVLATVDLARGEPGRWTVTLSEGIGGVVDGEPAETMLVPPTSGDPVLLSSARAVWQKVLRWSGAGGIDQMPTSGTTTLLTAPRLADLRSVVHEILRRYEPVRDADGMVLPWDVEFGFVGDRVVLFQIRPLVTNRRVRTLQALSALDAPSAGNGGPVQLDERPGGP